MFMENQFGRQLKLWRKRLKLSQQALSLEADISTKHLSQLETGKSHPSRKMVEKICQCLRLSAVDAGLLLAAAGFESESVVDEQAEEIREALALMLRAHEPNPGIITDIYLSPFAISQGTLALLDYLGLELADFSDNINFLLADNGLRRYLKNWQEVVEKSFYLIKAQLPDINATSPLAKSMQQLLKDKTLKQLWDNCTETHSDRLPVVPLVLVKDELQLSFTLIISNFGLPKHIHLPEHEYQIDFFYPSDAATATFMQRLAKEHEIV
jgi:transcriptional regulator with XRE-family HTH domain